jgi:biofilm PGA synthesis N-glycosyltransferase PgaC
VHLATNQGKAMALRAGALVSIGEYLMCVDGDVILDKNALYWAIAHFNSSPRVGAVTGNPRVRTRSTLLGKIQVAEFSSLVGLIKRAQRVYGRVFTVSGAVSAFRRAALQRVGYWDLDMITEDIDISWKLQLDHWDVRFEPNMLCWLLMPETLGGLWRQRLRWAQGGVEVLRKNVGRIGSWRARRMWPVYLEFLLSVVWSYTMIGIFLLWLAGQFVALDPTYVVPSLLPGWSGVLLGFTCLVQFAVSLRIDSRYEKGFGKYYYWVVWYPFVYWIINVLTIAVGTPKALRKAKGTRAIWVSPDRGLRT